MSNDPFFQPELLDRVLTPTPRVASDTRALFVTGCAGSGCASVAETLAEVGAYDRSDESHLLPLLARMLEEVRRQYRSLSPTVLSKPESNLISNTDQGAIENGISNLFLTKWAERHPQASFVDANPECEILGQASRGCAEAARLFPKARFVYLWRRPIDLAEEMLREHEGTTLHSWLRLWRDSAAAWAPVRNELGGRALEVHHHLLYTEPEKTAAEISAFLELEEAVAQALERALVAKAQAALEDGPYTWLALDDSPLDEGAKAMVHKMVDVGMEAVSYPFDGRVF